MPNIKRRFADDDPSSDDEGYQAPSRGGGKQLRMMGKQLHRREEEEEEDSDEEEEEVLPQRSAGPGKYFRPQGGKQLSQPQADDDDDEELEDDEEDLEDEDDDEDDDEVEPAPVVMRPMQRGGGKSLMRPQVQEESEEDDDEDEPAPVVMRPMQRGGGKSLMRPQAQEESDDDDDDDEEEEPPPPPIRPFSRGGGKALMRPPVQDDSDDDDDDDDDEDEVVQVPAPTQAVRPVSRGGGKALMRAPVQDDSDDDEDDEEEDKPVQAPVRRGGGKALLRPPVQEDESDDDDDDDDDEPEPEPVTQKPVQPPDEKAVTEVQPAQESEQISEPAVEEDAKEAKEEKVEAPKKVAPVRGGKQLRGPAKKDDEEFDDDDDEEFDDDDDDDDDEEFEEAPAPPPPKRQTPVRGGKTLRRPAGGKSLRKPASESEESSDDSSEEEMELDADDPSSLIKGEEDQKQLDALPELEREAILADRFEKAKNAADMRRALKESKRKERAERRATRSTKEKAEKKAKKSAKADSTPKVDTTQDADIAAALGSSRETGGRNRDATGVKSKKAAALADLRQRKSVIEKEKEADEDDLDYDDSDDDDDEYQEANLPWHKRKQPQTRAASSRLKDVEDDNDSDVEMEQETLMDRTPRDGAPVADADLDDYIMITLPRRRLSRWCNEPFFKQAVKGCFVRILIGDHHGKKCYRLCQIKDIKKGQTKYNFPALNSREKPIKTNKLLILKFGSFEKEFPMYLVSDSRPTQEDVNKHINVVKSSRSETVLSKRQAAKLRRNQDDLVLNYTYTQEDIEKNLKENKMAGKASANTGLEQTRADLAVGSAMSAVAEAENRLADAKRALMEQGNDRAIEAQLVQNIQMAEDELEDLKIALEERKKEQREILEAGNKRKNKLTQRRKDVNWAKVNQRNKALNENADFDAFKEQQARKEADAKGGTAKFNPYARRKVKPKILWEVGQKEEKKDDDPTEKMVDEKEDQNGQPRDSAIRAAQAAQAAQKAAAQSHQFNLDEDDDGQTNGFTLSGKKQGRKRDRKGISLTEYQERKAAGTL